MIRNWLEKIGIKRVESLLLAAMIALPLGFVAFGESAAWAEEEGEEEEEHERGGQERFAKPATPADIAATAVWKNECGSCHVPYPTRMLPAAGWQKVMTGLNDHFGSDATIDDPAVAKQITGFLTRNAGDPGRIVNARGGNAVPIRITETRWFVREHDEVRASTWKRPSIKSAANCGACHQGAAEGNYGERGIRIPKQ